MWNVTWKVESATQRFISKAVKVELFYSLYQFLSYQKRQTYLLNWNGRSSTAVPLAMVTPSDEVKT